MSTTTEGKLYFIEVDSKETLEIQFVPEKINVSRTADIVGIKVVARNTPQYQITGGETKLSMKLDFFAEDEDRKDVFTKVRWLESLLYIDDTKPPSRIQLVFGELYKKELWTLYSCDYDLELFHRESGYLPQQAWCNVVLVSNPKKNLRVKDIRNPFKKRSSVPMF